MQGCVLVCVCVWVCVQLWSPGGKQDGLLYIFKKAVREASPTITASASVNYWTSPQRRWSETASGDTRRHDVALPARAPDTRVNNCNSPPKQAREQGVWVSFMYHLFFRLPTGSWGWEMLTLYTHTHTQKHSGHMCTRRQTHSAKECCQSSSLFFIYGAPSVECRL